MSKASNIKQAREELQKLSSKVKPLVKSGKYANVNVAIIAEFYRKNGNKHFRKFNEWQEMGYRIRKGSKGFPVWGAPIEKTGNDGGTYLYYPVTYLFSDAQVYKEKEVKAV